MSRWQTEKAREQVKPEEAPAPTMAELEAQIEEELTEVQKGFRERTSQESKRFLDVCDSEYWFCVSFTSRAQKEELLKALGFHPDEKYIDGRSFAKKVGRALKTPDMEYPKTRPFDKDFLGMVKE